MPRLYENAKQNFSSLEEFKEVATKTLNEIYGRVKPLDVIDFSYNETHYKAVGYYSNEEIPDPQTEGAPLSEEAAAAVQAARELEATNVKKANEEAASEELRIKALYAAKEPVSYEDLLTAAKLGVALPEEIAVQLEQAVKEGRMSYEAAHMAGLVAVDGVPTLEAAQKLLQSAVANQNKEAADSTLEEKPKNLPYNVKQAGDKLISDKALELAEAKGVDISKIDGTGRDGVIKKSDVEDYIANNAPAKENANGNGEQQSNG